ncbi:MAG: hypothetical protein AABX14_04935 [Candidatus Aenigmatarchaeota archaeon]
MGNRKSFYAAMSNALGEPTITRNDMVNIFINLGAPYREINKKIPRVFAEDIGIDPLEYHVRRDPGVYMAFNVWNYLKHLEEIGKLRVPLSKRGIHCFNDLIENKYHAYLLGHSMPGRQTGWRHLGPDEDPSFDRAVKEYER